MTDGAIERRESWQQFLQSDPDLASEGIPAAAIEVVELAEAVEELLNDLRDPQSSGRDASTLLGEIYAHVFHINHHHNEFVKALGFDPN